MLRISYPLVTLTLALFQFGCSHADRIGEDTSNAMLWEGVTPESNPPPMPGNPGLNGTWTSERTGFGHFDKLVLLTDGRYHTERQVVCVRAPCPPIEENGTFLLYNREGVRYIAFVATGSKDAQRYEYVLKTDLLRMRHILPGSEWYSLQRATFSWCAEAKDCAMQPLLPGLCSGGYMCIWN